MNVKKRTESVNMVADGTDNVILNITVGNAQLGGSLVQFEGNPTILAKGKVENLNLGTKASLQGKTLLVTTNIMDVNDATNGVVVTYFFHACQPPVVTFNDIVDNPGDIFSFNIQFKF